MRGRFLLCALWQIALGAYSLHLLAARQITTPAVFHAGRGPCSVFIDRQITGFRATIFLWLIYVFFSVRVGGRDPKRIAWLTRQLNFFRQLYATACSRLMRRGRMGEGLAERALAIRLSSCRNWASVTRLSVNGTEFLSSWARLVARLAIPASLSCIRAPIS